MALDISYSAQSHITTIIMTGLLTRAEYRRMLPHLKSIAADTGPLHLVIVERDFEGWAPPELEGKALSALGSDNFLHRVAVVASEQWRVRLMNTVISSSFVPCCSFNLDQHAEAERWIKGRLAFGLPDRQRAAS